MVMITDSHDVTEIIKKLSKYTTNTFTQKNVSGISITQKKPDELKDEAKLQYDLQKHVIQYINCLNKIQEYKQQNKSKRKVHSQKKR